MAGLVSLLPELPCDRVDVLDKLEEPAAGYFQIGRHDTGTGDASHRLDLVTAIPRALAYAAAEQCRVERDRCVEIRHREADVMQAGHSSTSGASGASRPSTSSSVSCRLTSRARLPLAKTVPGRASTLKFVAAAS